MVNIRKAMEYGLTETEAMDALTKTPATILGVYDKVGSLEAAKLPTSLFLQMHLSEKAVILQNWVQGDKYNVKEDAWNDIKGTYNLVLTSPTGNSSYLLDVKSNSAANVIEKIHLPEHSVLMASRLN